MPADDMPDFVAEDPGQLGFVQTGEKRIGDKNLPARQGEGIDRLLIRK